MSSAYLSENVMGSHDGANWCWHLKRNISLTPVQMAVVFGGLSMLTLLIGLAFYNFGASFVLPFAFVEVVALAVAFVYNAIHANDYEKLVLTDHEIQIESKVGFQFTQVQMVRSLTRIEHSKIANELIELKQGPQSNYFGQFIHTSMRLLLAEQISKRMMAKIH
jgi:uncharacterized membrane protein